jgi:hypothetical protein
LQAALLRLAGPADEFMLVDYFHTQAVGLVQLRTGVRPGDHEVGLAADRSGRLAAQRGNQILDLLAAKPAKRG